MSKFVIPQERYNSLKSEKILEIKKMEDFNKKELKNNNK